MKKKYIKPSLLVGNLESSETILELSSSLIEIEGITDHFDAKRNKHRWNFDDWEEEEGEE